jgi:transcriptional regulator
LAEDKPSSLFERFGADDVRALIESHPLAWVCAQGSVPIDASLLPLVGQFGADGQPVGLIGHMMRSNPVYPALVRSPSATILFSGPDSYISPEHAGRRDWAPTWNYAQVRVSAEVTFDEALTEPALKMLIEKMECGRERPWTVEELGPRYHAMLPRIIGFRARVTGVSGKFKLGQDEDEATYGSILERLGDNPIVPWMRRFDENR